MKLQRNRNSRHLETSFQHLENYQIPVKAAANWAVNQPVTKRTILTQASYRYLTIMMVLHILASTKTASRERQWSNRLLCTPLKKADSMVSVIQGTASIIWSSSWLRTAPTKIYLHRTFYQTPQKKFLTQGFKTRTSPSWLIANRIWSSFHVQSAQLITHLLKKP